MVMLKQLLDAPAGVAVNARRENFFPLLLNLFHNNALFLVHFLPVKYTIVP